MVRKGESLSLRQATSAVWFVVDGVSKILSCSVYFEYSGVI
jgi:hypothetical protein